jgi:trimeric autotransporter adhesin
MKISLRLIISILLPFILLVAYQNCAEDVNLNEYIEPSTAEETLPQIAENPSSLVVQEGGNIIFSVLAVGNNLRYQWYKDDLPINEADEQSFVWQNALVTDGGLYFVEVSNSKGVVKSQTVSLVIQTVAPVNQAPMILTQPANRSGFSSQTNITLSVSASGQNLSYQWYKQSTTVGAPDILLTGKTQSTLAFTPVVLSNAGKYRVIISNSFGSVTSNYATVSVERLELGDRR